MDDDWLFKEVDELPDDGKLTGSGLCIGDLVSLYLQQQVSFGEIVAERETQWFAQPRRTELQQLQRMANKGFDMARAELERLRGTSAGDPFGAQRAAPRQQQRHQQQQQQQQQSGSPQPQQHTSTQQPAPNSASQDVEAFLSQKQLAAEETYLKGGACTEFKAYHTMVGGMFDHLAGYLCKMMHKAHFCYLQLYKQHKQQQHELQQKQKQQGLDALNQRLAYPTAMDCVLLTSGPNSRVTSILSPGLEDDVEVAALLTQLQQLLTQRQAAARAAAQQAEAAGQPLPLPRPVLYDSKGRKKLTMFGALPTTDDLLQLSGKNALVYAVQKVQQAWANTWNKTHSGVVWTATTTAVSMLSGGSWQSKPEVSYLEATHALYHR
jgi:hypothetical protein